MGKKKQNETESIEVTKTDLLALLRHHIHLPPKDAICLVEVEFAGEFLTLEDEKIVIRWTDAKVQTKTEAKARSGGDKEAAGGASEGKGRKAGGVTTGSSAV